ncbi:MAG: hypothetical protein AB7D96_13035 [Arcobacteraceae bacterium]|jgi:hypothetical protein
MEAILKLSIFLTFSIFTFIVYELFRQLEVFLWIRTHPQFDKFIRILGATIEGVSISVVGAAVYQWFLDDKIMYYALFFGTIWILIGAMLKNYKKS